MEALQTNKKKELLKIGNTNLNEVGPVKIKTILRKRSKKNKSELSSIESAGNTGEKINGGKFEVHQTLE